MHVGNPEQPEICIVVGINIQDVSLIDALVDLYPVKIALSVAYKVLVGVGIVEYQVRASVSRSCCVIRACLVCQPYGSFICKIAPDGYPVVAISCTY